MPISWLETRSSMRYLKYVEIGLAVKEDALMKMTMLERNWLLKDDIYNIIIECNLRHLLRGRNDRHHFERCKNSRKHQMVERFQ